MSSNAANQETEGLLSPLIRSVRFKKTAALIEPNSMVLDLACGGGFLRKYLPPGCSYFGVDRIPPSDLKNFDGFLLRELMVPNLWEELQSWLPQPADVITMLAFVEHIKAPEKMLANLKKVLKEDGQVILTTPHPIGRKIHDCLARIRLCSSSAAAEHESFLGRRELENIAQRAGFEVSGYHRFLAGLNQVFAISPRPVSFPQHV
jgi:2-polyprenyl-3-methyl-5-hydroxy-6-metoxy-1,4-benzoquinol methylase